MLGKLGLAIIFLLISYSIAFADVTKGLVGWWKFGDGSGTTAKDSSHIFGATENDGTLENSPTWVTGKIGPFALNFNGGSQYVTTNYASALNDLTVCVWFNSSSDTGSLRIVDTDYAAGFWLGHETAGTANKWGGGIEEGSSPYGLYVTLVNGSWHHLCSVRSGTTHIIYGDGGKVTASETVSSAATSGKNLNIAATTNNDGANFNFNGKLDDVRVYNRALSAAEIWDIYQGGSQNYGGE